MAIDLMMLIMLIKKYSFGVLVGGFLMGVFVMNGGLNELVLPKNCTHFAQKCNEVSREFGQIILKKPPKIAHLYDVFVKIDGFIDELMGVLLKYCSKGFYILEK